MYKVNKKLRARVSYLTPRKTICKKQSRLDQDELIEKVLQPLNNTLANFVKPQIKIARVAPKGRRYTLDDKIMDLILHKQSSRAYRLFSKIFPLPSRITIMSLLNRIPIRAGINEVLFDNLKAKVKSLKEKEKHCVVMFDEVMIDPHISLNSSIKEFEGFEDFGDTRDGKIADRALVFLIKGITREWKQPILYTFSNGAVKTIDLVRLIKKNAITNCQKIGLNVVSRICDQGSNN